jgi:hypothetical protein
LNPIAEYLRELAGLLRRRGRRRILAEVGAHLLEAVAADALHDVDPDRAAARAVARFGSPLRVASQFNAVRRRPRALLRRAAAVTVATAGMATLGTATVWALEPGPTHVVAHARAHVHHPAPPLP